MITKDCLSYPVSIFIAGDANAAAVICHAYCQEIGYCVTVTETSYVYRDGPPADAGVIVGLINYPRFPAPPEQILAHAQELASRLRIGLGQESYSIQAPDKTLWISFREEA